MSLSARSCFYLFFLLTSALSETPKSRIIGGSDAHPGQFLHVVNIEVQTPTGHYFCGGSLISNRWILTAGQCVDGATLFVIQLGSHKLTGTDPNRVTVATSSYVIHPEYNPVTLENDIGLIELRMAVQFQDTLQKLDVFYVNITQESDLWAVGWGQTSDETPELADNLHVVEVAPLTTEECLMYYGNQITNNTVCVQGNYNEGICFGDTGSPLVMDLGRGYRAQGGIASFVSGNGCESTDPSGYLRTAPYRDWITNVTGI